MKRWRCLERLGHCAGICFLSCLYLCSYSCVHYCFLPREGSERALLAFCSSTGKTLICAFESAVDHCLTVGRCPSSGGGARRAATSIEKRDYLLPGQGRSGMRQKKEHPMRGAPNCQLLMVNVFYVQSIVTNKNNTARLLIKHACE